MLVTNSIISPDRQSSIWLDDGFSAHLHLKKMSGINVDATKRIFPYKYSYSKRLEVQVQVVRNVLYSSTLTSSAGGTRHPDM